MMAERRSVYIPTDYGGLIPERVEPTPDEARNGWDAETLRAYLAQRLPEQLEAASFTRPRGKPKRANSAYRPKRWRR